MQKSILSVVLLLATFFVSSAQNQALRQKEFNLTSNLAISGYDPVAYFTQSKAVKGKPEYSATYNGVMYRFSSSANKDLFGKTPAGYEPQYGGWCAYAMGSTGEKVDVDPGTFKILTGKLYLFYNAYFNNTLKTWNKDENNLKAKADTHWSNFIK